MYTYIVKYIVSKSKKNISLSDVIINKAVLLLGYDTES